MISRTRDVKKRERGEGRGKGEGEGGERGLHVHRNSGDVMEEMPRKES